MGEPFQSFDESWAHFLSREEPLESFLEGLPRDERTTATVWLIEPDDAVARAVVAVQRRLESVEWLRPLPLHFLHVTLDAEFDQHVDGPDGVLAAGRHALRGLAPFRIALPRVNCFHEAVVAEVEGDGVREAAARLRGERTGPFLPHLSVAYAAAPGPPEPLRRALAPIRATDLGAQEVNEVSLCRVPAARTTILRPWTVVGRVRLG